MTALSDEAAFFASVRGSYGALSQSQVDGFHAVLGATNQWPLSFAAYGLATAWHETARTMQPVAECCYLGDRAQAYRETLSYYPWYGRGYVQLTWRQNYQKADDALALGGALIDNPDVALEPSIAAEIMARGMTEGWFSGKKLSDYLSANGPANTRQFQLARYIINGQDNAVEIADEALNFQSALSAGQWV